MDLYQFTENDVALMRELLEAHRNKRLPLRARPEDETHQAPEVYVVRTPAGGIAGSSEGDLTGTGSEALEDDSFPSATCLTYRISESGLPQRIGPSLKAYNVGRASVPANRWAAIERDKWGRWIIQSGAILADEETYTFTYVSDCSFNESTCEFTRILSTVTITGRNLSVVVS